MPIRIADGAQNHDALYTSLTTAYVLAMIANDVRTWRLRRRFEPPWDVLRLGEVGEGHPAGEDDIDEHEDPLGRQVGEDVAGGMVGAVVGQFDAVLAGPDSQLVVERDIRERAVRVFRLPQQAGDLGLRVEAGSLVKDHRAGMVGMVVAVDGMGDV